MADTYNEEENLAESELAAEYDATFDGDERASNFLKLTSDAFGIKYEKIKISEIGFTDPIKKSRQNTMSGLTATVKDMGVLVPIHVMTVEDPDDDYKYVLLDGLRRIYAAARNGLEEIHAIIWDFPDKDQGVDLALYISLILNRTQKRNWAEIWHLYQILELQGSITPGTLEYLLQLEAGEAMKLKDVMLCDYEEVKLALMSGEKDLEACYKMLTKLRKEEDKLGKEDETGVESGVEGAEELAGGGESTPQLDDADVRELLDMADDLDDGDDLNADDFDSMNRSSFGDEQQKVGERHPLDPALRQSVLARDNFTCRCCGMRLIGARLGLIAVHHVLPVHVGGRDIIDNLVTLCISCHIALHVMERNGGSIMMSQTDYNALPDNEKLSLKRALKLARVAIEADKRKGYSREEVAKLTRDAIKHPMPGDGLKENQTLYAVTKTKEKENENLEDYEEQEDIEEQYEEQDTVEEKAHATNFNAFSGNDFDDDFGDETESDGEYDEEYDEEVEEYDED